MWRLEIGEGGERRGVRRDGEWGESVNCQGRLLSPLPCRLPVQGGAGVDVCKLSQGSGPFALPRVA